jgi:hypothetical protein
VRRGGAAFSFLVESWDEAVVVVSCVGGEEEMGCEGRTGGIGKEKSFCTIWRLSAK